MRDLAYAVASQDRRRHANEREHFEAGWAGAEDDAASPKRLALFSLDFGRLRSRPYARLCAGRRQQTVGAAPNPCSRGSLNEEMHSERGNEREHEQAHDLPPRQHIGDRPLR